MSENIIEIKGASISINEIKVLENFNFEMKKGEFVYIIGETGSGKSTFLRCLYCSQKFLEGTAKVDNFNLNNINKPKIQELRRNLGIIFQDFKLLEDRNIHENLKFILKSIGWKNNNEIDERIRDTLRKVGLEEKANKMPYELSGGEQQRASIARAIVNKPSLIIADEPTGNLDPKKSIEIVNLLKKININGSSVIIATHDYDIIKSQSGTIYECCNKKLKKIENLSQ